MKTPQEVQKALGGLVQAHIARESSSPFVAAASSQDRLTVSARDKDGGTRHFKVSVEEVEESPLPSDLSQKEAQDGPSAQSTGCCQGTQTCNSDQPAAQEGQEATQADQDKAPSQEAPAAS